MTSHDTITLPLEITSGTAQTLDAAAPEQLSLLDGSVPLQFRLDERTRRSGLRHVAALRQQMVAQAAARRSRTAARPEGEQQPLAA